MYVHPNEVYIHPNFREQKSRFWTSTIAPSPPPSNSMQNAIPGALPNPRDAEIFHLFRPIFPLLGGAARRPALLPTPPDTRAAPPDSAPPAGWPVRQPHTSMTRTYLWEARGVLETPRATDLPVESTGDFELFLLFPELTTRVHVLPRTRLPFPSPGTLRRVR